MLSKQSIRKEVTTLRNESVISKDELIELSKTFNEREINAVKKMIRQGGKIRIHGELLEFIRDEGNKVRNSKGEYESRNIKPTSLSDFDF